MKKLLCLLMGVAAVILMSEGCSHTTKQAVKPSVDTVIISGMQFHPAVLSVNKGDTVIWINKGIVRHNVTAYPDSAWTSGKIEVGASWKKEITDSLSYFCSIHPTMKGKIKINQPQ